MQAGGCIISKSTKEENFPLSSSEVPNLGYICLSEGVHLRLAIEEKYIYKKYI